MYIWTRNISNNDCNIFKLYIKFMNTNNDEADFEMGYITTSNINESIKNWNIEKIN